MPSNKKLIEQARELAAKLEIVIEPEGFKLDAEGGPSNTELAALVKDLKAKTKDAATQTAADDTSASAGDKPDADLPPVVDGASDEPDAKADEAEDLAAAPAEVKPRFELEIAPGKSITCKKGVLAEGDEVKLEWLGGGRPAMQRLIDSGHVLYND